MPLAALRYLLLLVGCLGLLLGLFPNPLLAQQPPSSFLPAAYRYDEPLADKENLDKLLREPLPEKVAPPLEIKPMLEKVHPRKKILEEAELHTERSWLYSVIVPGLGQAYNGKYWRLPLIYGVFAGLVWGAVYNHDEYMTAKREFIAKTKKLKKKNKDISSSNLGNFMTGRKRDRTIFIVALGVWHLINIFDAYVMGTLYTFDVSDDLSVVMKPSGPDAKNPSVGLSFSLQPKEEPVKS
jgi:hypothetical protein